MIILPDEIVEIFSSCRSKIRYRLDRFASKLFSVICLTFCYSNGSIQTLVTRFVRLNHLFRRNAPATACTCIVRKSDTHQEVIITTFRNQTPRNIIMYACIRAIFDVLYFKNRFFRVFIGRIKYSFITVQKTVIHLCDIFQILFSSFVITSRL